MRVDALLHAVVQEVGLNEPPENPVIGQCWVVGDDGESSWSGKERNVAYWTEGGWRFVESRVGLKVLALDRGHEVIFDGDLWVNSALRSDGVYVGNSRVLGPALSAISDPVEGEVIDTECRIAVIAILNSLREHGMIKG